MDWLSKFFRPRSFSLRLRLLEITLPRVEGREGESALSDIGLSEQLFSALSSLGEPFVFEISVHHLGEGIHFYLAVPRASLPFAMEQIHGLFPTARVQEVDDYTIINPHGEVRAARLSLAEPYLKPIRSYVEAKVDTLGPIVSTLSRLEAVGDGATIQILVRPAEGGVKKRMNNAIESLKKGYKFSEILRTDFLNVSDVVGALQTSSKNERPVETIVDEQALQMVQGKMSHPLFSVIVRIVTSSATADHADDLLTAIAGSFAQFSSPDRNSFVVIKPQTQHALLSDYAFRQWRGNEAFVLSSEELASIFHLPTTIAGAPRVAWLKTHESAAPSTLPSEGVVLGTSEFRGEEKVIRIAPDDRRRHVYLLGQTGTGKSYLMRNMAIQDIEAGKGVCVIDPHGDLINEVLASVPRSRIDDVIVFDPGDLTRPLGLNMLEFNPARPEEKTFIVNEMQSIFNRLFSNETMGPVFEQYMRNALLLLMEDTTEMPTLLEVPRIFTDVEFRKRKLAVARNPVVIDFWEKEAVKTSGEQGLANMTPYITSKFNNFIANDYMRPIIGQRVSSFKFRSVMDEGKILLVSLAKGRIGDINAQLLGMIVVGRLLLSALSRTDMSEEARRDFYLYIDEFQNFTTDSISIILSEARKYRLCLTLAHQFIAQLPDPIKGAVFGNVGSLALFRVGADDAEYLKGQVAPEFSPADMIGIENRRAIVKLLIQGEPARPFTLRTKGMPAGSSEVAEKLKELSRLTYGKDLQSIEADILARLRL